MVQRVRGHGKNRRSRLRKHRERTTINSLLQEFVVDQKVVIDIDSGIHSAMPLARFQGRVGTVIGTRGDCYEVEITDGNKDKTLVVGSAHLKHWGGKSGSKNT